MMNRGSSIIHRRRGAFSLIELVLVIVIATILAAVAMPRYASALTHWRVDAAAHRVAADLALARNVARTASSTQIISFSTTSYQLVGYASIDGPASSYTVNLAAEPYGASI